MLDVSICCKKSTDRTCSPHQIRLVFFTFTSQRQHLPRQKKKRRKLISIFSNERKENDRPAGWGIITCDIDLTFGRFTIPSQGHQTSAEKCQAMHEKYWWCDDIYVHIRMYIYIYIMITYIYLCIYTYICNIHIYIIIYIHTTI